MLLNSYITNEPILCVTMMNGRDEICEGNKLKTINLIVWVGMILLYGCLNDRDGGTGQDMSTIALVIKNTKGEYLAGAKVEVDSSEYTADQEGRVSFMTVQGKNIDVDVYKVGYKKTARKINPENTRRSNDIEIVMTSYLEEEINELVKQHEIPGVVGTVLSKHDVLDIRTSGTRKANGYDLISNNDLFHIGSITKSMTSTMIAALVEQGYLSWKSKPTDIIEELDGVIHEDYKNMTLLDILHHRSGLPNDEQFLKELNSYGNLVQDDDLAKQRMQVSLFLLKKPAFSQIGDFNYSNAGYVVAAAMAERATGKNWRELMDSFLFTPLNINAHYGWPTEYSAEQPEGHDEYHNVIDPAIDSSARFIEPAGYISLSIADLAKYIQFQMRGASEDPYLLSKQSFNILQTPVGLGTDMDPAYACGLVVTKMEDGSVLLSHSGSNDYFYSQMFIWPESDISVAIMTNIGGTQNEEFIDRAVENVINGINME